MSRDTEPCPMPAAPQPHEIEWLYRGLLRRLNERAPLAGYDSVSSLPQFESPDLAIILQRRPDLLYAAVADSSAVGPVVTHYLATEPDFMRRMGLIGNALVGIVSDHVRPLLLMDLQEEREAHLRRLNPVPRYEDYARARRADWRGDVHAPAGSQE
jgi:hypothetical protein